jgi:hypothetical protein
MPPALPVPGRAQGGPALPPAAFWQRRSGQAPSAAEGVA